MKYKLFLFFIFSQIVCFSQEDIYLLKDLKNNFTLEDVQQKEFYLLEDEINEGYTNATYWFKIPAYKTDDEYVFRITYDRHNTANAYQDSNEIEKLTYQRYLTYRFSRDNDVFIKIKPKLHSYIPIEFDTEEKSFVKQKHQLILNCFYYGFAFLVIVYNFFYYTLFKDDSFLYYSLFLGSICLGIYTMDGMLNFYNINGELNEYIMVFNYLLMVYCFCKFANSYLFLDIYYPKLKKFSYTIGFTIILVSVLYIIFKGYYILVTFNILIFSLLFIYWIFSILLFHKNFYNKILTIAYVVILFSAIDFFVLKFLGISVININSTTIKIGAFIEMIILSIAVLYRVKILKIENRQMKDEIIKYSKEIKELSTNNEDEKKNNLEALSIREKEIFCLIVIKKTNKEISTELNISINTVKFHVKNIYEKLDIKSRKEAIKLEVSID